MTQDESNLAPDVAREEGEKKTRRALAAFWFVALTAFWGALYGDYLFAVQENSLFIFRTEFLAKWLEEPAGILCWASAFLTQFFYLPYLGALFLAALGVALTAGTARLLRLRGAALSLAAVPALALGAASTHYAYYIYLPCNISLVFANILGATAAVWLALGVRRLRTSWGKTAAFLALALFGWPALGVWGILSALAAAFDSGKKMAPVRWGVARWALFTALALATPFVVRWFFYYGVIQTQYVLVAGITDSFLSVQNKLVALHVAIGNFLAIGFILIGVLASEPLEKWRTRLLKRRAEKKAAAKEKKAKSPSKRAELKSGKVEAEADSVAKKESGGRLVWELCVVLAALAFFFSYRDAPFFQIMAQNRALGEGDWDRILELDAKTPRPIEYSVALRNIALFEKGELGERAFELPIAGLNVVDFTIVDLIRATEGDERAVARINRYRIKRATQNAALSSYPETMLWRYGQSNIAARRAINKLAGRGGRSFAEFRTLAYCAMISGERVLAERYLAQVREAIFYRKWADSALEYVRSPGFGEGVRDWFNDEAYGARVSTAETGSNSAVALSPGAQKIAEDVANARLLRPKKDRKVFGLFPDLARLRNVFNDDFETASPKIQEAELVAALFQRGAFAESGDDFFMKNIADFISERPDGRLPKGIEQGYATLLYDKIGDGWKYESYSFSPETLDLFGKYVDFVKKQRGDVGSIEAQNAIREYCAGTYWGYAKDESAFIVY